MKITLKVRRLILKSMGAFGFLLFIAWYLPNHAEVWEADWKFLGTDDEGIWFYDSAGIECPSNNILRVPAKKFYDPKGVFTAAEKYGKDYMDLDHVICCWEIDCSRRKFKLISAIFHSKDHSIIQDYDEEKERYFSPEDIPNESYLELLRQKICR